MAQTCAVSPPFLHLPALFCFRPKGRWPMPCHLQRHRLHGVPARARGGMAGAVRGGARRLVPRMALVDYRIVAKPRIGESLSRLPKCATNYRTPASLLPAGSVVPDTANTREAGGMARPTTNGLFSSSPSG
jgi:hypothetical protein